MGVWACQIAMSPHPHLQTAALRWWVFFSHDTDADSGPPSLKLSIIITPLLYACPPVSRFLFFFCFDHPVTSCGDLCCFTESTSHGKHMSKSKKSNMKCFKGSKQKHYDPFFFLKFLNLNRLDYGT